MLAALFCALLIFPLNAPIALAIGALCMAAIGLVDDWRPFAPLRKFALTVIAAGVAVVLGMRFEWTGWAWVDGALTALWLVWMCHAFNVLDMADGLSAGSGAIAAGSLWLMGAGEWTLAVAGTLVGFLLHNTPPARVYMGDAGSLMFGFLLGAGAVLLAPEFGTGTIGAFVALGVITFEAIFISIMRFAKGRPISRASRDHTAQRLRQKGILAGETLMLMWGAGLALSCLSIAMTWGILPAWLGLGIAMSGACLAGYALARVDMEGDGTDGRPAGLFSKNWLVHRLMRQAMENVAHLATGRLLDVGCGARPYAHMFSAHVSQYIGLERDQTRYGRADLWADALALPVRSGAFDTVLCNQVLEHVPEPQRAMNEMARVLRPNGTLILTAPHIWGLHEVPHDYYRFTPYGLRHLAVKAGLSVVEVRALAGFWVTAGARFCYYLSQFDRGILKLFVRPAFFFVQLSALILDRLHRVESEAWNFLLIARK